MPPKKASAPVVNEVKEAEPYIEIDPKKIELAKAFDLFAFSPGIVHKKDIPLLLRSQKIAASDEEIEKVIIPKMTPNLEGDFVKYKDFEKVVTTIFESIEYEAPSQDIILSAFRAFDPKNRGFIPVDKFKEVIMGSGDCPLTDEEFQEMISIFPVVYDIDNNDERVTCIRYDQYVIHSLDWIRPQP